MVDTYDDGDDFVEDSAARVLFRWVCGFVGVVSLALFLGVFTFTQMSEQEPAEALLASAMVHISQIDDLLNTQYYEDLFALAAEAEASGDTVTLPQFPVEVTLEPTQILDANPEELRDTILRASAAKLYESGLDAMVQPDGETPEIDRFSQSGTIDMTIGNLTRDSHDQAESLMQLIGIVAVLALALFLLLGRGFSRITMLGAAVLGASLLALVGVFLVRLIIRTLTSAGGDPFVEGLNEVVADASELPIYNFTTTAVLGLAIVVFGVVVTLVSRRFEFSE